MVFTQLSKNLKNNLFQNTNHEFEHSNNLIPQISTYS